MISDTNMNLLFVHIPKTGGETISATLRLLGGIDIIEKHATFQEAAQSIGCAPKYSLAVVRNPFDQVVSFYQHLRKPLYVSKEKLRAQYPHLNGEYVGPVDACKLAMRLPFNAFVDAVYYRNEVDHPYFRDQTEFICGNDGNIACTDVFKFEHIEKAFARLRKIYGIASLNFSHLNKSERAGYEHYYEFRAREIIEGYFHKTINIFGYSFNTK